MFKVTADRMILDVPQRAIDEAKALATESAEKYQNLVAKNKAPYHQNTVHSHFIGKIGEIGAALAFQGLKSFAQSDVAIDEVFRDSSRDRECDLIINGLRVEVKCWKPYAIEQYGPCISDRQAIKLHKKCDAVVYATFDQRTKEFQLIGWNTMDDIAETPAVLTGPANRPEKQVLNRKMSARNITELPVFSHKADEE